MVTVDASIWVAAEARGEPYHADCRAFLVATLGGRLPFHQPLLSIVEVCAAVARKTRNARLGIAAGQILLSVPSLVLHDLDVRGAREAAELASETFLRAADAVYVATTRRAGTALVTLDRELYQRATTVVATLTPAEWLARNS